MAKQKLIMLLNLGLDDQTKYGIPDGENGPPAEGEVISVEEETANVLTSVLKVAKPYVAKEAKEHAADVRAKDAESFAAEAQANVGREQAEKDAAKAAKGR